MNSRDANDRMIREAQRVAQARLTVLEQRASQLEEEIQRLKIDEAVRQAQLEDVRADHEQTKAQLRIFSESLQDLLD